MRLPLLDLKDAIHVARAVEAVTTRRAVSSDQPLALEKAEAGVGDIGIGRLQAFHYRANRHQAILLAVALVRTHGNLNLQFT